MFRARSTPRCLKTQSVNDRAKSSLPDLADLHERERMNEEYSSVIDLTFCRCLSPLNFGRNHCWRSPTNRRNQLERCYELEEQRSTRFVCQQWQDTTENQRESVDRSLESENCLLQSMLVLRDSPCRSWRKPWEHRVTMDSLDQQTFYSEEESRWMERAFWIRLPNASEEEWKTSLFASASDQFWSQQIVRTGDNQRVLKRSRRSRFLTRNRASLLGHCRWHRSWDDRWQHSYHQRIRHRIHQRTHARHHL